MNPHAQHPVFFALTAGFASSAPLYSIAAIGLNVDIRWWQTVDWRPTPHPLLESGHSEGTR
jgi:hypothetical protein